MLLARLLEKPEEFLSTILIGNNLVNVAAASIATFCSRAFSTAARARCCCSPPC